MKPTNHRGICRPAGAVLLLLLLCGCQLANHPQRRLHPQPTPVSDRVTIGGTFAESKSLAIPESGLTLSEAIELSIRPGVERQLAELRRDPALATFNLVSQATARTGTGDTAARQLGYSPAVASKPTSTFEDAFHNLIDRAFESLDESADSSPLHEDAIADIFDSFRDQDGFSDLKSRLTQPSAHNILLQKRRGGELSGDQSALLAEVAGLVSASTQPNQNTAAAPKPRSASGRSEVEGMLSDYQNQFVVRLHRPSEPTKIIPLELVRMTQAGDIQLAPGDHVELIAFTQTALGRRNQSSTIRSTLSTVSLVGLVRESIAVGSLLTISDVAGKALNSQYNGSIDLMILRPILPSEENEEYWYPRVTSGAYSGVTRFVGESPQRLIGGDEVRFTAMKLVPVIRNSQIRRRVLERLAEEKQNRGTQKWREEKLAAERNLAKKASVFPGVSPILDRLF